jgi:hypothetical protein
MKHRRVECLNMRRHSTAHFFVRCMQRSVTIAPLKRTLQSRMKRYASVRFGICHINV